MLCHEEEAPLCIFSAVSMGNCALQIQAAAQRQGTYRLTEESAISLRVWSDPTAKIILASGEMVTEL
jgi:hypothetical protein